MQHLSPAQPLLLLVWRAHRATDTAAVSYGKSECPEAEELSRRLTADTATVTGGKNGAEFSTTIGV